VKAKAAKSTRTTKAPKGSRVAKADRAPKAARTSKAAKTTKTVGPSKADKASKDEVTLERRLPSARRDDAERRTITEPTDDNRRNEVRRKVPRRRQIDPTTCERDYSDPEIEFMQAMDDYKRANGRMFPTCSEILEVLEKLGYQKVGSATDLGKDASSDSSPTADLKDDERNGVETEQLTAC